MLKYAQNLCSANGSLDRLRLRSTIAQLAVREALWMAGVIRDPDENPPKCSPILSQLLDGLEQSPKAREQN